jgi:hypothetical protein
VSVPYVRGHRVSDQSAQRLAAAHDYHDGWGFGASPPRTGYRRGLQPNHRPCLHCYDWPAPCWSKPTTNGKSRTNATYPKPLWLCSNPPPTQATNPLPSPPLSRHGETHRASGETPARFTPLPGVPSALFLDDLYEVTHLGRRQRVLHEIAARCGRYVCAGSPAPD